MRALILFCLVVPLAAASRKKETEYIDPDGIYECDFQVTLKVPDPAPFPKLTVGEDVTLRFRRDGGRYTTLISSEMRKNWMHQWFVAPQLNPADSKVYGTIACTYDTPTLDPHEEPVDCQELLEGFFPTREVVQTVDGMHNRAFVDGDVDGDEMARVSCYTKSPM